MKLSTLAYNQEEYSDIIIFSNMKFLAYTVTHFACNTLFTSSTVMIYTYLSSLYQNISRFNFEPFEAKNTPEVQCSILKI